jgi:hypothetical protein
MIGSDDSEAARLRTINAFMIVLVKSANESVQADTGSIDRRSIPLPNGSARPIAGCAAGLST